MFRQPEPTPEPEPIAFAPEPEPVAISVIVVAASGEYPFFSPVRFPAQYATVVGVTGTKVDGTPWSGIFGAGRGPSAKIAAPAYKVWHAETEVKGATQDEVKPECPTAVTGKGTSFSAPIVAMGCSSHPDVNQHHQMAEQLGRIVAGVMGW